MRTKTVLLASSAIALLAATPAQAGDFYVSVFGGANWLVDSSGQASYYGTTFAFRTDADTGFVLGGAIGAHLENWAKGLRAELEASYRRQDVGGRWNSTTTSYGTYSGSIDGNQSTFAIMANVWYDIDTNWKVKPYIGGGVGWARTRFDAALTTTYGANRTTDDNNGFAWQLGAGFNYQVQPGVDVGLGYRYFDGPNLSFGGENGFDVPGFENENHSVLVNLNVAID